MAEKKDKKGLFGKAIDAVTNRDEKETIKELEAELAEAKKEAAASKEAVKSLTDRNAVTEKGKDKAKENIEAAEKRIADLESKLKKIKDKEREESLAERRARKIAAKKPDIITTHTVDADNPTLSHIALKYYNHATPPYWKYLLEHNKEVLDGSEKNVRIGMKLEIPELPEDLKD